jgi:hypothetical protein
VGGGGSSVATAQSTDPPLTERTESVGVMLDVYPLSVGVDVLCAAPNANDGTWCRVNLSCSSSAWTPTRGEAEKEPKEPNEPNELTEPKEPEEILRMCASVSVYMSDVVPVSSVGSSGVIASLAGSRPYLRDRNRPEVAGVLCGVGARSDTATYYKINEYTQFHRYVCTCAQPSDICACMAQRRTGTKSCQR